MNIVSVVLESAQGGEIKSRIKSKASLSFSQLEAYLKFLNERGMIQYDKERKLYLTTEKGLRFLIKYKEVEEVLSVESYTGAIYPKYTN
jgi:predicted transcriptional regulator